MRIDKKTKEIEVQIRLYLHNQVIFPAEQAISIRKGKSFQQEVLLRQGY